MIPLVLEVLTGHPVSTELAVDLQLKTVVFEMLQNSLVCSHLLLAAEALNYESLALGLDVLLEVLNVDTL